MKKSDAEFLHAKKRAVQRHFILFNKKLQDRLIGKIRNGQATLVKRQSQRVTIWQIEIDLEGDWTQENQRKIFKVVYDKKRHQIITFLP